MYEFTFYHVSADNKTIKKLALQSLKGKWAKGYLALLTAYVVVNVPPYLAGLLIHNDMVSYFSLAYEILAMAFFCPGIAKYFLNLTRGTGAEYNDLLKSADCTGKTIAMFLFFMAVYAVCSGYIILFIAGFAMLLRYIMSFNVLAEHSEKRVVMCFTESSLMMRGNKLHLFGLLLSFTGWVLLAFSVIYFIVLYKVYPVLSPYLANITDLSQLNSISQETDAVIYQLLNSLTPVILAAGLPLLAVLEYALASLDVFYDIAIGYLSFADSKENIHDAFSDDSPHYRNIYREKSVSCRRIDGNGSEPDAGHIVYEDELPDPEDDEDCEDVIRRAAEYLKYHGDDTDYIPPAGDKVSDCENEDEQNTDAAMDSVEITDMKEDLNNDQ